MMQMFGPDSRRLLIPFLIPVPVEAAPGGDATLAANGRVLAAFRLDERNSVVRHIKGLVQLPR
jgi:hypothetical protein